MEKSLKDKDWSKADLATYLMENFKDDVGDVNFDQAIPCAIRLLINIRNEMGTLKGIMWDRGI